MKLDRSFYSRSTRTVARELLGKVLVRRLNGRLLSGMIVETEAYVGPHDLACHASKGRTARTEVMFSEGGVAYVYMIYGFYFCLNAVTEAEGYPAAVLIRAVEPLGNRAMMEYFRNQPPKPTDIASGPGKLCMAMQIDRSLNGESLTGNRLWVEDRGLSVARIARSPRVGVDYAGVYRDKPWRFFVSGNPHVSRPRGLV
jgi:DNA-3-methyladenine glycosylase